MSLPLYRDARAPQLSAHANRGLWFERFADLYSGAQWQVGVEARQRFLAEVSGDPQTIPCGDAGLLQERALRTMDLVTARGGRAEPFRTSWRFVTGLGLQHPLENGFTWHYTLGVPYLPGSGLKGLLGAWLAICGEPGAEEERRAWLGTRDGDDATAPERAGDLVVFDALPLAPVVLKPDVMTPHMGQWYEQGPLIQGADRDFERIPGDWHDPIPVPFLTVEKATFLVAAAPRRPAATGLDLDKVFSRLKEAMSMLGAGAKTAAGYGRLRSTSKAKEELEANHRQWMQAGRSTLTP